MGKDCPAYDPAGIPPVVDPSLVTDRTHEHPLPPNRELGRGGGGGKGEETREGRQGRRKN